MTFLRSLQNRRRLAVVICLLLLGTVCILVVLRFVAFRPASKVVAPDVTAQPGLPLRLKIPKIGVDAGIDYVGLTPEGDLDVPKSYESGGWYKDGPHPGAPGSAVIDGHFGRADRQPAIFDKLNQLQKGDELYVTDVKGTIITFVVTGSRSYNPGEDATAVFRSTDGVARLNLITCQGTWDGTQNGYVARLVVFTEKQ